MILSPYKEEFTLSRTPLQEATEGEQGMTKKGGSFKPGGGACTNTTPLFPSCYLSIVISDAGPFLSKSALRHFHVVLGILRYFEVPQFFIN